MALIDVILNQEEMLQLLSEDSNEAFRIPLTEN